MNQQFFFKYKNDLPLFSAAAIDQPKINSGSKPFSTVTFAQYFRRQAKHLVKQPDNRLLYDKLLFFRHQIQPFARLLSDNGTILGQRMSDQPSGADAQKMLNRLFCISGLLQFVFQSRKRTHAEILMQTPVCF